MRFTHANIDDGLLRGRLYVLTFNVHDWHVRGGRRGEDRRVGIRDRR
jgi:hypothetical protein